MISCILLTQFDNKEGTKIVFQYPSDFVSPELFELVSDYLITKPQMCGKVISWKNEKYKFRGIPQQITGSQYERNALWFNLTMVFTCDVDTENYNPILIKIGKTIRSLEIESSYLTNDTKKQNLFKILPQIVKDLNSTNETFIQIDDIYSINLKLFPILQEPSEIESHTVPIQIRDLSVLISAEWDLTLMKIIPHINGVNFVKQISKLSNVELSIVKKCLKHLLYYNYIEMIDIFSYFNTYRIVNKEKMSDLFHSTEFQDECVKFLKISNQTFRKVLISYSKLKPGVRLRDVVDLSDKSFNHRLFIAFGLLHKFIKRCHSYPILLNPEKYKELPSLLKNMLNGKNNADAICCELQCTRTELRKILNQLTSDCKIIYK
eukprot:gene2507-3213_t